MSKPSWSCTMKREPALASRYRPVYRPRDWVLFCFITFMVVGLIYLIVIWALDSALWGVTW